LDKDLLAGVRVLVSVDNVAAVPENEFGNSGNETPLVGARNQ
jgi:hypothetical protein